MRLGMVILGVVLGAGAFLMLTKPGGKIRQGMQQKVEDLQDARAREDLEEMLDEVAHQPDIPETPVKQAFEQALHEHPAT